MKWRSLEESGPTADTRSLREIYSERKALIAKYAPAETQSVHAQAIAELRARHLAGKILSVGEKIPSFELQDHEGKIVRSADLLARCRLVLCFIRGRWCPFCVGQMEAMNLIAAQIESGGGDSCGHIAANREAIVLHARSAQAAVSLALRCGK